MKLWIVLLAYCVGALAESPPASRGKSCEIESPCVDNPCQNRGRCSAYKWVDLGYRCRCEGGWLGKNCTEESPCVKSNPCQHGGRCVAASYKESKYKCYCRQHYYGNNCAKVSPCKTSNPCQNSGHCYTATYNGRGYQCYCRGHHYGINCEKESACKHGNPCQNEGQCRTNRYAKTGYNCNCKKGFGGQHCQLVDPCFSDNPVCQNGGTCGSYVLSETNQYTYSCICPAEYAGKHCETESPCMSNPCKNGGTCSSNYYHNEIFYCQCPKGFRGQQCQSKVCPVQMTCRRDYSISYNMTPSGCLKQEEASKQQMESCKNSKAKAIRESKSCDCTLSDYASTKLYHMGQAPYSEKYFRCLPRVMDSLATSCDNATLQCLYYLQKASRFMRPDRNCSEELKVLKKNIVQCHDDYNSGKINFKGCEFLDNAYKSVKPMFEMYLKLTCTDCDITKIGQTCTTYNRHRDYIPGFCEQVEAFPQIKSCVKKEMEANARCAHAKDAILRFIDSNLMLGNQRSKKTCEDINSYGENLKKMGCSSNAPSFNSNSTITKRSIEKDEWDPFNINHFF